MVDPVTPTDPVAVPTAPVPGSDEYNAAMAAKYETPTEPDSNAPDAVPVNPMPEGGYDKFYNKETGDYNWQAHAVDAEYRAKGDKKAEKPADKPAEAEAEVEDIVVKAGLKMEDLGNQIRDTGTITDEAKSALMAQGIPEALIDEHVSLAAAHTEANTNSQLEHVGGEEQWNAISTWAATNLNEADKAQLNTQLSSADWQPAMDELVAAYKAASPTGGEKTLRQGDQPGGGGESGYGSKEEMMRDQQNPLYRNDPAFRAKVIAKIDATDMLKIYASYDN